MKKLLQQALDALSACEASKTNVGMDAIDALEAAIAQGESEPVAYLCYDRAAQTHDLMFDEDMGDMDGYDITPLYAAPQVQPESEPVAIRHSFDGYGWMYIDNGSGSGWRGGIDQPGAEFLYTTPQAQPDESDDLTIAYMAGAASSRTKAVAVDYVPLSDEAWQEICDITGVIITRPMKDAIERAVRGGK